MKTINRVLYLTNFISKTQLATFLEISRPTLDFYLNTPGKWRNYQVEKIDELFDYVKNLTSNNQYEVKRIYFKKGCLISSVNIIRKLY